MTIKTIMRKIQENDVFLAEVKHDESYAFYIDISNAMANIGKYQAKYYDRCEREGMTLKEAQDQLGEYLRSNLTLVKEELDVQNKLDNV